VNLILFDWWRLADNPVYASTVLKKKSLVHI